jgi:hypothetical protein
MWPLSFWFSEKISYACFTSHICAKYPTHITSWFEEHKLWSSLILRHPQSVFFCVTGNDAYKVYNYEILKAIN